MSVATALTDLSGRIQDAYTALAAKGATIPASRNSYNLSATIDTVPTGGGTSNPLTRFVYNIGTTNNVNYYEMDIVGTLPLLNLPGEGTKRIYYCSIGSDVTSIGA